MNTHDDFNAPRHQMNESLMGRQHTDQAHRISFTPPSFLERNGERVLVVAGLALFVVIAGATLAYTMGFADGSYEVRRNAALVESR